MQFSILFPCSLIMFKTRRSVFYKFSLRFILWPNKVRFKGSSGSIEGSGEFLVKNSPHDCNEALRLVAF